MLELVNVDFAQDPHEAERHLTRIVDSWSDRMETESCKTIGETLGGARYPPGTAFPVVVPPPTPKLATLMIPFILLHRNFIKSHRDVVAYGVRLFMYLGLSSSLYHLSRPCSSSHRSRCLDGHGMVATESRSVNDPA
jgi:hypothetical protein